VGEVTKIAWCHHTFSPWWGCLKIAPECKNCYAADLAHRWGYDVWGADAPRRFFGDKHWNEPVKWNRAAEQAGERRRVFCASMADVLEDRDDLIEARERWVELVERTPWLDWLLLTKRAGNAPRMLERWQRNGWPRNVWFGTTIAHPDRLDEIAHLRAVDAAVRFISIEPLIAPLTFWDDTELGYINTLVGIAPGEVSEVGSPKIDWIILGGESGPRARPLHIDWVRRLISEGRQAGAAVFVKQLGSRPVKCDHLVPQSLREQALHRERCTGTPIKLVHRAGEDPSEWPADLRVREFPQEGLGGSSSPRSRLAIPSPR
jgi:protein gp37